MTLAAKAPEIVKPWMGPVRGFSFKREVQPVLDRYCVSCHDGGEIKPSLLSGESIAARKGKKGKSVSRKFTSSYLGLNDGSVATCDVGRYPGSAWGLHDMHGNAAEWTRSAYQPYPFVNTDGRNRLDQPTSQRVLRGGSYYDRPHRARSAFRLAYPAWQRVYNAGFRVVMEIPEKITRR